MSQKKTPRRKNNNNNNNEDDLSTSSKHETKGLACIRCKERKKKCNKAHPTCDRCLRSGHQCLYRMKFDSAVYNRYTPEALQELEHNVYLAEQLGHDLEGEIRRQLEEIERMKRTKNQLVLRSVTLYKCSQLIYMLNCYMPALQPTTGNQVPYIKISHFFKDTNPARQGAMFAMLANAALMLEDTRLAERFRQEANKCLLDAGEPTPQNMALYVSALIDLGTHHQAFFDFETAIGFYYRIKRFAEDHPQLFFAALRKKRANQHALTYQDNDKVKVLQEKQHYSGRFQKMVRKESPDAYDNSSSQNGSPNLSNDNNAIEEDDSSDSDLPPEDDGKTTYAVDSYALPKTAEESLLFHLGYAFEALMLMTRDKELDMIRKEIEDSNKDKLGEHNIFNEIREQLHALNQIATYCIKKGLIMQWDWFEKELAYIERRMQEVEFGRRIFLYGQKKLVHIHGLIASKMKKAALENLEELILIAQEQFYYGKTNVLGYGYLFSACVCYKHLHEYALFDQTKDLIESYKVPGLLLAERCIDEINKYEKNETDKIAPYFTKLAAILDADHPEQTKFYLMTITDPQTGEMTLAGQALFPKYLHGYKGQVDPMVNNNNNNNILQAQALSLCESNSGSFSSYEESDHYPATVYQYSNNNNNNNSKQDVYDNNSNGEFIQTHQDFSLPAVADLDIMMQPHEEANIEVHTNAIANHFGINMNRAPHLEQNHQLFNNNNQPDGNMFYVYGTEEYSNNNNNATVGNYTMDDTNQHQSLGEEQEEEYSQGTVPYGHVHLQSGYSFPIEE